MSTTFVTISTDGSTDTEWPDGWEEIVTRVEGDLADKIRGKVGAVPEADVQIFERGDEGGYSEWTVEWDWSFRVEVAGIGNVWESDGYSQVDFDDTDGRFSRNALTRFIEWVNQ